VRRIRFIRWVVVSGLRWAKELADHIVNLRFSRAGHCRRQLVPAIESTIDQLAHIQARLWLGLRQPMQVRK